MSKKIMFDSSIHLGQFDIHSDIMVALDYFTPYKAKDEDIKLSVDLTIEWGKRCKDEFERQCEIRKLKNSDRPILFYRPSTRIRPASALPPYRAFLFPGLPALF